MFFMLKTRKYILLMFENITQCKRQGIPLMILKGEG